MKHPYIDLHTDIVNLFKGTNTRKIKTSLFETIENDYQINIPNLLYSKNKILFSSSFAFYDTKATQPLSSFWRILYSLNVNKKIISSYNKFFENITDNRSINHTLQGNKIGVLFHLKWIYWIQDEEQIDMLYNVWVRSIWLTRNQDSDVSCSYNTTNDHWLTRKWAKLLKHIETKWIILDLANASDRTFDDVCKIYHKPILVSHTAVRSLHKHKRNISDKQLWHIKSNWWLVWINFSTQLLNWNNQWEIKDVVSHLKYVIDHIWIDHVWIWTNFCGKTQQVSPIWLDSVKHMSNFVLNLRENGFSETDIDKILYKNSLRFISDQL